MSENMKCPDCAAPLVVGTRCAACGWYALGHSPMEERLTAAKSDLVALRAAVEALRGLVDAFVRWSEDSPYHASACDWPSGACSCDADGLCAALAAARAALKEPR